MASISSLGVGSGLDLNGMIQQLGQAEASKLEPIQEQTKEEEVKLSAYGEVKSALASVEDSVSQLGNGSLYESLSASSSNEAVTATAGEDAAPGQYQVEVGELASAGSLATGRVASDTDAELLAQDETLALEFGDSALNQEIDLEAGSSLADIRDTINAGPEAGVSASIVQDGEGARLTLMSQATGADASITGSNFEELVTTEDAPVGQPGQDASLSINGIDISSASNSVEGAIQGVDLELSQENASSTVSVERDRDGMKEAVTGFVEAYNAFKGTSAELTAVDSENGEAAELVGDATLRTTESRLSGVLSGMAGGGELSSLGEVGITLEVDGTLTLDEGRLDQVARQSPDALRDFFAGDESSDGLAGRLDEALGQLLGSSGTVETAIGGSENRIESLGNRATRMEEGIEQTMERYRTEFGQLDGMIAEMNQTSQYLSQQLSGMGGGGQQGGGLGGLM
ncbi:MAG: flagellar filament capping protein FliD [Pseudomonadota bacterium]